ncbi:MAG TPA: pyruvate dehydrogenase complex dihydrolipoamide acetyltransferase [Devosiaceae bacterium]|nr:pyruvate dehydrogenase complex dihydrolipoamide acetyltransferase [Devosiaceae bacterium]
MTVNITMPALSPTMEEGTLAKWHVKEGDTVAAGDVIAEIETDKATMEVEAVDEGVIGKLLVAEGTEGVAVNAVIAVLLGEGETAADIGAAPAVAPRPAESKAPAPQPAPAPQLAPQPAPAVPAQSKPVTASAPAAAPKGGARVIASPLARRLAAEAGIELSALSGSGPHGRMVKRDIEQALEGGAPARPPASTGAARAAGMGRAEVLALYEAGSYDIVPNDGMRRIVAERLTEAKQTVPHFYLTMDCRIDRLMEARAGINAAAPKDQDGKPAFKLSVNDFVIKVWAAALKAIPHANATWAGDAILYHKHSDIGVAVAVPGGLFTPVVRQAELKSLRQISEEMKDFATRARSKKLAPHEYLGGSSAVSNLGMYGVKDFAAVINPPHGTILAVGVGEERVFAENGEVKVGQFMSVTLSCDHRSVNGALGAEVLAEFRALIENPVMMLA